MDEVQRWNRYTDALEMFRAAEGDWVTYADAIRMRDDALAGAVQRARTEMQACGIHEQRIEAVIAAIKGGCGG